MRRASDLIRAMATYRRAWEARDAELVLSVFTQDAIYHDNPLNKPMRGHAAIRRYWAGATAQHRRVAFHWKPVVSSGNLHVIEWTSRFTRADSGMRLELRGVMILTFRGKRIASLREYWLRKEL